MVKSVTTIYACDFCGLETVVWDEADNLRFESEWHSSLTFDLCPACKESPRGMAKILVDTNRIARLRKHENLKG